jgi:hypothetical protein
MVENALFLLKLSGKQIDLWVSSLGARLRAGIARG